MIIVKIVGRYKCWKRWTNCEPI